MKKIENMSEKYLIRKFKIRVALIVTVILLILIGGYSLFIYTTNPHLIKICLITGIIAYAISMSTGMYFLSKTIKNDYKFRKKIIATTKTYTKKK